MNKKVSLFKRVMTIIIALFVSTMFAFADGEASEVYLSGTTNTAAGDFVVTGTDEVYHFQGEEYTVYNVYYDNPQHNMKIAVLEEGDCKSYIAFTKSYWFKYDCTRDGFGVRKSMFNSAVIRDGFDAEEYRNQTILVKSRKIEKDQAVGLIAAYLPRLQG